MYDACTVSTFGRGLISVWQGNPEMFGPDLPAWAVASVRSVTYASRIISLIVAFVQTTDFVKGSQGSFSESAKPSQHVCSTQSACVSLFAVCPRLGGTSKDNFVLSLDASYYSFSLCSCDRGESLLHSRADPPTPVPDKCSLIA
jgi:hypothetical protein